MLKILNREHAFFLLNISALPAYLLDKVKRDNENC